MDILDSDALVICRALDDYAAQMHQAAERESRECRFNSARFLGKEAIQARAARNRILKALNIPT